MLQQFKKRGAAKGDLICLHRVLLYQRRSGPQGMNEMRTAYKKYCRYAAAADAVLAADGILP